MLEKPPARPDAHSQTTSNAGSITPFRPTPPTAEIPDSVSRYVGDTLITTVDAPSGPVGTIIGACCPKVATFEGSTGDYETYFGFDDKTNQVADKDKDEYWIPPDKRKKLPKSDEERDGARWVSVGCGETAQVQINFAGKGMTSTSIGNCSYRIVPPKIATVVTEKITKSGAEFTIKGNDKGIEGEAVLKVKCNFRLIGYFYIWCAKPATIMVDICTLKTPNVPADSNYSKENIETHLKKTFRQAVLDISVRDLGVVDLSDNDDVRIIESEIIGLMTTPPEPKEGDDSRAEEIAEEKLKTARRNLMRLLGEETSEKLQARRDLTEEIDLGNGTIERLPVVPPDMLPREGAYRVYRYITPFREENLGGETPTERAIRGFRGCFCYYSSTTEIYGRNYPSEYLTVIAHELGHCLGLNHPCDHDDFQFPEHLSDTVDEPVPEIPATNTEPMILASDEKSADGRCNNIMAADPLNLMGYYHGVIDGYYTSLETYRLRVLQWYAIKRS